MQRRRNVTLSLYKPKNDVSVKKYERISVRMLIQVLFGIHFEWCWLQLL